MFKLGLGLGVVVGGGVMFLTAMWFLGHCVEDGLLVVVKADERLVDLSGVN